MIVVEMKPDRVFAYALCRNRSDCRLEHRQRPRRKFCSLPRLPMRLRSLLVAQRARTGIAQERKGIMRLVAILPLNIETRTRAQVDLHRLRVCHDFKYRTAPRAAPLPQNLVKPLERPNFIQLSDSIPNIFSGNRGIYLLEPVILVLGDVTRIFPCAAQGFEPKNQAIELSPLEGIFYGISRSASPVFIDLQEKYTRRTGISLT
jgi:hypothetical protein